MDPRRWKNAAAYVGLLGASYVIAIAASWRFGAALDNIAYDYMFRRVQPKLR
jgi:hypothetical protein